MIQGPQGQLYMDDGGQGGLPVIFLHSAGGNTGQWVHQLRHLRSTRRAIALDLRGHGRSALPADGDFSVAGMAQDVAALADQLALGRFVLVGHSLGGHVATAYAGANPGRIAGLFLLDPASDGRMVPKEQADGLMAALRSDAFGATVEGYWQSIIGAASPAIHDRIMADLRATPATTMIGGLESLLSFDPVTPLRAYRGPKMTLITALNETPASLQNHDGDLKCEKITGTGHWPQLEKPDEVNARLDAFLAGIDCEP
jgi:pimeloyl-ACP methyl ester carboxylesterase